MNKSFSVLIPDGESEFALFAAHCLAHFPNVKLHILSGERWAPIRFSRHCQSYTFKEKGIDDETRLNAIADIVGKHKIDVLLPTETKWISFVVANREALSKLVAIVPLPDAKGLQLANDKWLLAQFLDENGIPCPPTILATCDDLFEEQLHTIALPVLLKPITAWGGDGIERFDDLISLKRYLAAQGAEKIKGRFIVQSLRPGFVVGVNVLARNGQMLATTMQRGIIPNTQKYAAAGAIKFIKEDKFQAIAQKLVSTLKWSGFANLDTLYDSEDNQLKILEINARFWGSLRGSLIAGVSFPYLACLAALDIPFPMPDYQLAQYIHPKTAVREGVAKLLGRNQKGKFPFQETGLRFLLADPLAEAIRVFRQEVLDKEKTTV
jgi:D-aspartate ligase